MSSGAYGLLIPAALIAAPVAAVAGAAFIAVGAVKVVQGISHDLRAIDEQAARERELGQSVVDRVNQFVDEVTSEMNAVSQMLQDALEGPDMHVDTTQITQLKGIASLDHSRTDTGFSDDELFFTELDVATGRIVYVAIDFSEVLSVSNARNSTEYKKMQIASAFTKRLMRLCVSQEQQKSIADFIDLMNQLLDDKTVTVETFERTLAERFAYLERDCSANEMLDAGAWAAYCAICAMRHEQPRRITNNAELYAELRASMQAEVTDRYRAGAGVALRETLQELGLEVGGEVELEQMQGSLFTDPENPDYSMFVSTSGDGFVVEMTENGTPGPDAAQHKAAMCAKRKTLVERMKQKGYIIKVIAENDESGENIEHIEVPQETKAKDTAAERMRKRRMIAGKKGKSRAIGGV